MFCQYSIVEIEFKRGYIMKKENFYRYDIK